MAEKGQGTLVEIPRQDKTVLAIDSGTAEKHVQLPIKILRQTTPFEEDAQLLRKKNVSEMFAEDVWCHFKEGINGRIRQNTQLWMGKEYEEEIKTPAIEEVTEAAATTEDIESQYVMGEQNFVQSEYMEQTLQETEKPQQDFNPQLAQFQSWESTVSEGSAETGMGPMQQLEAEKQTGFSHSHATEDDSSPDMVEMTKTEDGDEKEPAQAASVYAIEAQEPKKAVEEKVEVQELGEQNLHKTQESTTEDEPPMEITSEYAFYGPMETASEYVMDAEEQGETSDEQEGKTEDQSGTTDTMMETSRTETSLQVDQSKYSTQTTKAQKSTSVAKTSQYTLDAPQQGTEIPDAKKIESEAEGQIPEEEGKDATTETISSEVPEPEEEKNFDSTHRGGPDDQQLQETTSEYMVDAVQATTSEYLMDAQQQAESSEMQGKKIQKTTAEYITVTDDLQGSSTGQEVKMEVQTDTAQGSTAGDQSATQQPTTQRSQRVSDGKTSEYIMDTTDAEEPEEDDEEGTQNKERKDVSQDTIGETILEPEFEVEEDEDLDTASKAGPAAVTTASEYIMDANAIAETTTSDMQVKDEAAQVNEGKQKRMTPDEVESPGIESEYLYIAADEGEAAGIESEYIVDSVQQTTSDAGEKITQQAASEYLMDGLQRASEEREMESETDSTQKISDTQKLEDDAENQPRKEDRKVISLDTDQETVPEPKLEVEGDEDLDTTQESEIESVGKTSEYVMDATEFPDMEEAEVKVKHGKDLGTTRKRSPVVMTTSKYLMDARAETTTPDMQVKEETQTAQDKGKLRVNRNKKGMTLDQVEALGIESKYVAGSLQQKASGAQRRKEVRKEAMRKAKSSGRKTTRESVRDVSSSGSAQRREGRIVTREVILPEEIPPISPGRKTEVQAQRNKGQGEEWWKEEYELVNCQFKIKLTPGGVLLAPHDGQERESEAAEAFFDLTPEAVWINKNKVWNAAIQN